MKTIQVTYQEVKMATRPNVYRNKKKYSRKDKSWKKSCLGVLLFILSFSFSFSQTNTSYLIENQVTKNNQTISIENYNQQYNKYMEKSYRQKNAATLINFIGGVVASVGYGYYREYPQVIQGAVYTVIFTSSISTVLYISSSNNRRKAYRLKKKSYL